MKPYGKNIEDTQYEGIASLSTHSLKNEILAKKSSYQDPKGLREG